MANSEFKTVSAVAVVDLANEMITAGLIGESDLNVLSTDVFNEYRLFKAGTSIVEHRLAETYLLSLWGLVDVQSDFAFNMGCTVHKQAKGVLAHWISYSDTLAQAFEIFTQNIALLNHAEHWQVKEGDMYVELEFEYQSDFAYSDAAIERSMVALVAWGSYFVQQPLTIHSAQFSFNKPLHYLKYGELFGKDLRFNAGVNRLVLHKEYFGQSLHSANPYLREVLQERSKSVLRSMNSEVSVVANVMGLLVSDLATYSVLEKTLAALHMSRATLYRKLKEQNTTFSELVKQIRTQKLVALIAQGVSNEDCAFLLGFSDVSSFYRFRKSKK